MTKKQYLVEIDDDKVLYCRLTDAGWEELEDGNYAIDTAWTDWNGPMTLEQFIMVLTALEG